MAKNEANYLRNSPFCCTFVLGFADVAQLVEQRIRNAWVRGSSPLIGSGQGTLQKAFPFLFARPAVCGSKDERKEKEATRCVTSFMFG